MNRIFSCFRVQHSIQWQHFRQPFIQMFTTITSIVSPLSLLSPNMVPINLLPREQLTVKSSFYIENIDELLLSINPIITNVFHIKTLSFIQHRSHIVLHINHTISKEINLSKLIPWIRYNVYKFSINVALQVNLA